MESPMHIPSSRSIPSPFDIQRLSVMAQRAAARWQRGVTPGEAARVALVVIAVGVVTGLVRPLPWRTELLAPVIGAYIAWLLARRWGDRTEVVVWAMLGLCTGMAAAQKMDIAA